MSARIIDGKAVAANLRIGLKARVEALVERAAAHVKEVGEEQAFKDFTNKDGGYLDGELYVFCYDHAGVNKAHGTNPLFIGKNLTDLRDSDGNQPFSEIMRVGFEQGQGWVDFKWPNPTTKRVQQKSSYVIRTNDVVCGVGYYR